MLLQAKINYDIAKLAPVVSTKSFQSHMKIYTQHESNYVNANEDIPFNKAGSFLHQLYFENIREVRQNNLPMGKCADIIQMRYGSWQNFVKTYLETVQKLQGSGWVFMNTSGYLNIIPNNRIVDHVAFVVDFFEHAYYLDYGSDRIKYAEDHLSIMNWDVVNQRILLSNEKKKAKHL